jgi:hypothetical protein
VGRRDGRPAILYPAFCDFTVSEASRAEEWFFSDVVQPLPHPARGVLRDAAADDQGFASVSQDADC